MILPDWFWRPKTAVLPVSGVTCRASFSIVALFSNTNSELAFSFKDLLKLGGGEAEGGGGCSETVIAIPIGNSSPSTAIAGHLHRLHRRSPSPATPTASPIVASHLHSFAGCRRSPPLSPPLFSSRSLRASLHLYFFTSTISASLYLRLQQHPRHHPSKHKSHSPPSLHLSIPEDLEGNLERPRLSSNIPNSLGNLGNLTKIDLSNNELGGSIPISFRNFGRIIFIDLSMNKLSGCIPTEVLDLPIMPSSLVLDLFFCIEIARMKFLNVGVL
ncbi:Leucine-rich repeat-containing protein [Cynara cardunculus var. scolymus]|uniref:Leucine-rich repeat-containing protein n=1 Tax=Cynara cardunculus var. scolymus TaxID=59895 RepID=A0A118K1P4_CYNCS|nr:Leucine-rich repeat-containing protein [Cynara cardunculus var. scolymus]